MLLINEVEDANA